MTTSTRMTVLLSLLCAAIAGCNGNASSLPLSPGAAARSAPLSESAPEKNPCAVKSCLYVGNEGSSITVYALNASGNVLPVQRIAGKKTHLHDVNAVAVDPSRNIYSANYDGNRGAGDLTIYPAGAQGNVAPTATISDRKGEQMLSPSGIGLDDAGNIYATGQTSNSISVYPPGSNGDPTPARYISGSNTGLDGPDCLTVTQDGTMYVTNGNGKSVTVYAAGSNGNVSPTQTISGTHTKIASPNCIAVDSKGKMYVSITEPGSAPSCCVLVFDKNASGDVAPIRTIGGPNTKIYRPYGIAVDSDDNIYVSNGATNSVTVYDKGANGDAAPIRTIVGAKTRLDTPSDLTVH